MDAPVAEPRSVRWQRRVRTIPLMLGAAAAALVLVPVAVPALAVADLGRGRARLPSVRVYLFALHYALNDSAEILLAGPYWLFAGFGRRLGGPRSIARHQRLQWWSLRTLARSGERLLGLRVEVDEASTAVLAPGPVVVLCRHVSIVDASLPALLYQRLGYHVRGVIMAEMLADPGFDLLYGRLGSVFVPRDDGAKARRAVAQLGRGLGPTTVAAIFPEGRLFAPDVLARAQARLAAGGDPARAERLAGLRRVLPPRPGGVLALLDAAPGADVVVLDHRGLDDHPRFADLARAVPLRTPLRVTARRIARADVPDDDAGRVAWLDDVWLALDAGLATPG